MPLSKFNKVPIQVPEKNQDSMYLVLMQLKDAVEKLQAKVEELDQVAKANG